MVPMTRCASSAPRVGDGSDCAERDSQAVVHPLRTPAVPLPRLPARPHGRDGRAPAAAGPESTPTSSGPAALHAIAGAAGGFW